MEERQLVHVPSYWKSMRLPLLALLLLKALQAQQTPVILISIDTLRADRVGPATPGMVSFAEGGVLFTNAESQTPLTLPSHTSLFTSSYPFQNGVQENAEHVPPQLTTLAGVLKAHGYETGAFVGAVFLERQLGLDQGFDEYDSPFQFEAFSPLSGEIFFVKSRRNALARERRDGHLVTRAAESWLNAKRGRPVFAVVHLFDLHAPCELPAGFRRPPGLSDYAAQLVYTDQILAAFRRYLVEAGWWDKSLVVLLSDHGESLGEHGEQRHGFFIYESTLHVPLILHWPAGWIAPIPARDNRPAGLIDVAPTILDFLHFPIPASFAGSSLLSLQPRPVYSESMQARDSFGWAPLRALREGVLKYIDAPHAELYDLRQDPSETRNLIAAKPGQAQTLRAKLAKLIAQAAPPSQDRSSPQTDAVLRSLGYLARGPQRLLSPNPADPKDRLTEWHLYQKAEAARDAGRKPEAIAILTKVLAADPQNTLARRDLAVVLLDSKFFAKARDAFAAVLAVAPKDYVSQFGLGVAYEHLGEREKAGGHLKIACELAPRSEICEAELKKLR